MSFHRLGSWCCLLWRDALLGVFLAAVATALYGCCDNPEPQLKDWDPDFRDLKDRAEWFDEKGIWRGNPSWRWTPLLEVEDYECKTMHPSRPICIVWTLHEWNCDEHDFGICKCEGVAAPHKGDYCEKWGCHALEADQEICQNGKDSDTCRHEEFPMTEETYRDLMQRQGAGVMSTGEKFWWRYDAAWSRRLLQINDTSSMSGNFQEARVLQSVDEWPPSVAYSNEWRHHYSRWGEVCIVNGDNVGFARRSCSQWREIETEISYCECTRGGDNFCMNWKCEERDVGLFSVLFRTKRNIDTWTTGTESEEYECKTWNDYGCTAWEGIISSREEVEWTRCECQGSTCHEVGAKWYCDEYELPKTLPWNHGIGNVVMFVLPEICVACMFCNMFKEGSEDAIPVACVISTCVGTLVFPFLMTTLGCYAFLAISLPFWIIRMLLVVCICLPHLGGTSTPPGSQPYLERDNSSRERLKRGATKLVVPKRYRRDREVRAYGLGDLTLHHHHQESKEQGEAGIEVKQVKVGKRAEDSVVRPLCKYGDKCYNKGAEHRAKFAHPGDEDWDSDKKSKDYRDALSRVAAKDKSAWTLPPAPAAPAPAGRRSL